ncbi:MAG: family 78 glycoside hydrolase catalytic domain [Planctomycetota bacterium]
MTDWAKSRWIGGHASVENDGVYDAGEVGRWLCVEPGEGEVVRLVRRFTLPPGVIVVDGRVVIAVSDTSAGQVEWKANTHGLPRFGYQTSPGGLPSVEGEAATFLGPGENVIWLEARKPVAGEGLPGAEPVHDFMATPGPFEVACGLDLWLSNGERLLIGTDAEWHADIVDTAAHPLSTGALPELEADGPLPNGHGMAVVGEFARPPRCYPKTRPVVRLRKHVNVEKPVRSMTLHYAALGWARPMLDGFTESLPTLDPPPSNYKRRAYSTTLDLTQWWQSRSEGPFVLGFELADGWYGQDRAWWPMIRPWHGPPRLRAVLEIVHTDGTKRRVCSDESWQAATSPITRSNVYAGEDFDGRHDNQLHDWSAVKVSAEDVAVEPSPIPPCRKVATVRSVGRTEPYPGVFVYDFGVNLVGRVSVAMNDLALVGRTLLLRHAETLHADGRVDDLSTGVRATRVAQLDRFTVTRPDCHEAAFTYHGFRYVQLSGLDDADGVELIAHVIHNDLTFVGDFACSADGLNDLFIASRRSYLGNAHGLLTDCPHRERCAWHADLEIACDFGLLNYDAAAMYEKSLTDTLDTLQPDGTPFCISVGRRLHPPVDDLGWQSLVGQVPLRLWRYRGDSRPARRCWPTLRRVLDQALEKLDDGVMPPAAWGDHAALEVHDDGEPIPVCDKSVYQTLVLIDLLDAAIRLGGILDDPHGYEATRVEVAASYQRRFGDYHHPTADAAALQLGLTEDAGPLRRGIAEQRGLNVGGFFGHRRIADAMLRHAPAEEAVAMLVNDRFPSLLWSLKHDGATTLYEYLVPPGSMAHRERSRNHPPLASICETFWHCIAGIDPHPGAVGLDRLLMRPHGVGPITWTRAHHDGPRGRIESSWRLTDNRLHWTITLPTGTVADVSTPAGFDFSVTQLAAGTHHITTNRS